MQISITFLKNTVLSVLGKRKSYSTAFFENDYIIVSNIECLFPDYYKITLDEEHYAFMDNSDFIVEYLDGEYDI